VSGDVAVDARVERRDSLLKYSKSWYPYQKFIVSHCALLERLLGRELKRISRSVWQNV
jgi:hypothetical protein